MDPNTHMVRLVSLVIALLLVPGILPTAVGSENTDPQAQAANTDVDDDGLLNDDEVIVGTYPDNPDSDGDGIRDGIDPDAVAFLVEQSPDDAFKSGGAGHRTAILSQLNSNEKYLLAGNIQNAVRNLQKLRKHMDGCPTAADKNDWIVDCASQQEVRRILDILLANHVSYTIETDIELPVPVLPGLNGGLDRHTGVAIGPEGDPESFVLNEVVLRPDSPEALQAFLVKYDGIILRDGTPTLLPSSEPPPPALSESTGSYLIAIDSSLSPLGDLLQNMELHGIRGNWSFSSEQAARTAAVVARESEFNVSLNFTMELLAQHPILEHPDDAGGNLDASTWWWMTEDDDLTQPGDQGLSVGVIHAWQYVRYKGYPPVDTPFVPIKVAIIDTGFDLDETTGEPLYGAGDYPLNLEQLDVVDGDLLAGGAGYGAPGCNGCWHGQLTFGTCCALSRNHYGTAGTSGGWDMTPLVIKVVSDLDTVTHAVYEALYNGADVVHETLGFFCGWWCRNFGGGDELGSIVKTAKNMGTIFITPAQNQGKDISNSDLMPCNRDGAVCVGAIFKDGKAADYSNWGTIIDTWAPTETLSAITRESASKDTNDVGIDELYRYGGTSAATPYLTGIVTLMKMANPNISYDQVRSILVSTSNPSSDLKVKDRGYVDAYRAVEAASPNLDPTMDILKPKYGDTEPYSNVMFKAQVIDPETPSLIGANADFSSRIVFSSSRDGFLCSASGDATNGGVTLSCEASALSLGGHLITAAVTDPFGAVAIESVNFTVINTPPTVKITYPADGSSYDNNQQINFRGYAFDEEVYGDIPLTWSSSLTGSLGSSGDFWISLAEGNHVITLTAIDEKGATSSDSITVHVQPATGGGGYPTAQILQPPSGSTFGPGTLINFTGKATDPEDGEITADAAFRWSSNMDGFLGTGKTLQHSLSSTGESTVHSITLEVTDKDGHKSTHTVNVTILNPM